METKFTGSGHFIDLEYLSAKSKLKHYHGDIELVYVIKGAPVFTVEEDNYALHAGDMLAINVNRIHSYETKEEVLLARFLISYRTVRELLGQEQVLFWCNSALEQSDAYEEMRRIINRILTQTISGEKNQILINSLFYQLLSVLTMYFLLPEGDRRYTKQAGKEEDRLELIFAYIRTNYNQKISLQDLADYLYLTPTYVSKYIKKSCGVGLVELLNSVRLGKAVDDLIHTDSSVVKIAMDNGFPSVNAFNRVFKESYQKTPSEFRATIRKTLPEKTLEKSQNEEKIDCTIRGYLAGSSKETADLKNMVEFSGLNPSIDREWKKPYQIINAGTALDLTNSEFQEQILSMQKRFGFTYVRFWDIYAPEFYIFVNEDEINFGRLDQSFDFLVKNGLKPYVELGFKPLRLLRNTKTAVREEDRTPQFENSEKFEQFFAALISHLVKRYTAEEISEWYFEYQEKEQLHFNNKAYEYSPMAKKDHRDYFEHFDLLAGAIRAVVPEAKVGGGGFPFQHYGEKGMTEILSAWKNHKELPDFISITSFPYQIQVENNSYFEKRTTDLSFISHNVEHLKKCIKNAEFQPVEVHVSEYSFSLSNRNSINDSCFKGAYLVHNFIECIGKTDILAHWLFTDLYAAYHDTRDTIFGGCGLLNKDGIPKPAAFAVEFLNNMYDDLVFKNENCLVTSNGRGAFRILCHNMKTLNYNYYNTQEDEVYLKDFPAMEDDHSPLDIHIKITDVRNGVYILKQNHINHQYGSIQNEWEDLNMQSDLNVSEIEYLKSITVPKLTMQEVIVSNHVLEADIHLTVDEIQWAVIMLH